MMLKIPAKHKRSGVNIKCLKCKFQVTRRCGLTKKSVKQCEYKDQHRFSLIVCIPKSNGGGRRTKIVETRDFDEALKQHCEFKKELKTSDYNVAKAKMEATSTKLEWFSAKYLDAISGINTPAHLKRKRSVEHIGDTVRAFKRFRKALVVAKYNFDNLDAKDIGDEEVGIFHEYLIDNLKLGERSYNKHIAIMKSLFNWIIRVKDYPINNPFNHVQLNNIKQDATIITKSEFLNLIAVVTKRNSYDPATNRYLYRTWLVPAYKLALETGLRREELLTLRWKDIVPIEEGKFVCRIDNLKVNRITKGRNSGDRLKYIPVTKSLMVLLNEIGYLDHAGSDKLIIDRPEQKMRQAMDILSRSFTHYSKCAGGRTLDFGVLRKTYITRLTMVAGPNAKLFTGSSSDEVLKNHYLSKAFMAANLEDFSVL